MTAPVSVEGLTWAGVDVATWAVHAIDLSGLLAIPARRGGNVVVAGRDGAVRVPRKVYGPREFVVEFWVRGCLPDGTVPDAGQNATFYESMGLLASLCVQDVATMVHTLPDGRQRTLDVEVINAVDPQRWLAGMLGRVRVAFSSASAWWRGLEPVTVSADLPTGGTVTLDELADSNGRIDDAWLTFGAGVNPTLTDPRTGAFIGYDDAIGSGQTLSLGAYEWATTGGLVFDRRLLRRDRRQGAWFVIDPVPGAGAPELRLDHTGSGTMPVTIEAYPSWAVG